MPKAPKVDAAAGNQTPTLGGLDALGGVPSQTCVFVEAVESFPPGVAFDTHPEPSPPGRCAWCGQAEAPGAIVIPFGTKPRAHTWLHVECWPAWFQARKAKAEEALPDLQGIVECSSGYDRIALEVWAEYDKAAANYRLAKIVNLHDEQAQNRSGGKTAPPATRK